MRAPFLLADMSRDDHDDVCLFIICLLLVQREDKRGY